MKMLNKIVITTAIILIPLAAIAGDRYDGDRDINNHSKSKNDDRFEDKSSKYLELKSINYAFEGELESKPTNGLNGIWTISGIKVTVNDKTFISHSKKQIKIGDEIEVFGKREGEKIVAVRLEQDSFFSFDK